MTRYSDFEKLKQLTALTKTHRGYSKFIQTGDLGLHDYNTGFIDLEIYVDKDARGDPFFRMRFGTIDDCDFGAFLYCHSIKYGTDLVEQVAKNVFEHMVAFPSHEKLNLLLRPYGVYVNYE